MSTVRPDPGDEVWDDLAQRRWRRIRWRQTTDPTPEAASRRQRGAPPEDAVCAAYGSPIHRTGTYYVRPAYTDGEIWLSQQGYDALIRRTRGRRASRRSGERP
ncbi:hypothetical protein [Rubricoccus marinus]|uniref:Uncharacterized protein n=1 Tax=Rubricoccus marinus TaxID=716817 RepID=A0A259TZK5_9BACT|nr:hypothetical protein [Rubricoccus marinus]OZC03116.1 hypothetical protein BSZ36_09105 [Rubricoccus marinus]